MALARHAVSPLGYRFADDFRNVFKANLPLKEKKQEEKYPQAEIDVWFLGARDAKRVL